ncbi:hypothetical protein Tco_0965004 [Tanacetum coccineum]
MMVRIVVIAFYKEIRKIYLHIVVKMKLPKDFEDNSEIIRDNTNVDSVYCQEALDKILEELEELKRDQRMLKELKKRIAEEQMAKENMSIEEMRHEQQLVDYKIKEIMNDLGYKRCRGEKIDEEYERDCEIRIRKLKQDSNEWGSKVRKKEQAYEEEKYSAARRYMLSITCDDEDDSIPLGDIIARYSTSKATTTRLTYQKPNNSLNMGMSISTTNSATESDKKFEDIDYVSFEEMNDVEQEEKEFDLEDILQIQDVILREKLLKISRLIINIESLKDNPIPVTDNDSSDTSLSHSNNSLPEFESFSDHTEETRSGSTTTHANYSLPEYESFHFDNPSFPRPPSEPPDVEICLNFEPDSAVINNFDVLNNDEPFDPGEGENVVFLNVEEDDSFTFTIRTFLPFVTYPEASPLSCSTGSEDTIFDPGIST